ncbi:MAG: hypothetical protein QOF37_2808 [Thermoleophilaceae bacterium]|jgi:outer membrane protein assembly factor BamB|nr:hypothetical protein [Thermoleophilaceae bacterium]
MRSPRKFISSAWRRHPRLLVLGALLVVGAGGALAAYLILSPRAGNYNNPKAAFETQPVAPAVKKKPPRPETFKWPIYGYTPTRTRFLDVNLHPPYQKLWKSRRGGALIEFQPVLANGVLYYVNNNAVAYALSAKSGRVIWWRKLGSLNASSPAWDNGKLYIVTLSGMIHCLNAKNGKVLWKRHLPSRAESSPIVVNGIVYFGSENGTVYALRAKGGAKVWTYHASGAVKAGLAFNKGNLYFGDYSGEVTALRASDGSRVWSTGTSGASFNRSGQFYSTPAVAYGRVYLGNTDGLVYSFVAKNGQLAWRHSTGNYVYAAPAVGTVKGLGPTVFIGSYDGNFYALDARSGNQDWAFHDGGKISGAPTVVGGIVYYSSLGHRNSVGLDVRNGKRVWWWPNGAFNPVISDGKRLYVTTRSKVIALVPKQKKAAKPKAPAAKKRRPPQAKPK